MGRQAHRHSAPRALPAPAEGRGAPGRRQAGPIAPSALAPQAAHGPGAAPLHHHQPPPGASHRRRTPQLPERRPGGWSHGVQGDLVGRGSRVHLTTSCRPARTAGRSASRRASTCRGVEIADCAAKHITDLLLLTATVEVKYRDACNPHLLTSTSVLHLFISTLHLPTSTMHLHNSGPQPGVIPEAPVRAGEQVGVHGEVCQPSPGEDCSARGGRRQGGPGGEGLGEGRREGGPGPHLPSPPDVGEHHLPTPPHLPHTHHHSEAQILLPSSHDLSYRVVHYTGHIKIWLSQ